MQGERKTDRERETKKRRKDFHLEVAQGERQQQGLLIL